MSKLSGIRDVDREILGKLDDKDLLKVCSIDKYTWNTVCDDSFLKRRLLTKYPEIEEQKKKSETWKQFFLRAVHYIALMKEKFDYNYTFGNFVRQYELLKTYKRNENNIGLLLYISSANGELALVIWSLKNGAVLRDGDLISASRNGHLSVVKYLVEHGANIHALNDVALNDASTKGHLDIVKYLVEHGANIHASNDLALFNAGMNGHLDVVKYLKTKINKN
jgi:hypothetical protein